MVAAYEKLRFYQEICELRRSIVLLTSRFGREHMRLVSQMRDAARSAKQNIREGYRKGTANEFIRSIMISRGSLEELSGDVEDCVEDGLITKGEVLKLQKLFRSIDRLSSNYLTALRRMIADGTWKTPHFLLKRNPS